MRSFLFLLAVMATGCKPWAWKTSAA